MPKPFIQQIIAAITSSFPVGFQNQFHFDSQAACVQVAEDKHITRGNRTTDFT